MARATGVGSSDSMVGRAIRVPNPRRKRRREEVEDVMMKCGLLS
jgi:hypothetical protein